MVDSAPEPVERLLLEHAWVLALDDIDTRGRLSIAIADGLVQGVGPRAEMRAQHPGARRLDCRGRIIMPGLVNAHLHPDLHVLKGELEDLGLHDWVGAHRFNAAVDYLGTPAGAPVRRAAVRASLAEAALSGTTCVGTYGVSTDSEAVCGAALAEIGLRGSVTIRDVTFAPRADASPSSPGGAPASPADGVQLPPLYRLHAEEALYQPELEAASRAHDRGERIVMHAAETTRRLDIVRRRFGTTTIRLLDRHGLLTPMTLLSHAVHVDSAEIEIMARRGVSVVVSPSAEMKLADGTPPVHAMLGRGITIALGTDAAVCNNSTDMFIEMRTLGLSQKLRYGAHALPAEQILRMATHAGAAALGAANELGRIAAGAAADLIMVDVANPRLQPLLLHGPHSNVAANLVYAATGSDVTDVMVGGRWIVRRRRLLTQDQRRLWRDLARNARSLHAHMRQVT